jgi:hypothetical protein
MKSADVFHVDLSDPDRLKTVMEQYLRLGVCPVTCESPGAMLQIKVELTLPDGTTQAYTGRIIQMMGPNLFLVQISEVIDIAHLQKIAELSIVPETPAATPAPSTRDKPEQSAGSSPITGYESDMSDVYAQIGNLSVNEKRRLARYGNRTVRQLLMKDPNKSLHVLVSKNPKVTMDEALEFSKRPNISPEALKNLAENQSFRHSKQLKFNLVRNPSTPLDIAKRLLKTLSHHEWRVIAKSPSVRTPITAEAKKLVIQKLGKGKK